MSNAETDKAVAEMKTKLLERLMGDLKDDELRSLQLHMDVLNQWARLGNARPSAMGHDHDHMDDHDHAMKMDVVAVSLPADLASTVIAGSTSRTKG